MIPISRANNTVYFFNERNEPKDIASEIWIQIFSEQSRQGVSACFLTCKFWKKIVAEDAFLTFKKDGDYFGKVKWNKYYGDIGMEPPLPKNIQQILNAPCPFWPDEKVKETHLLVLVPQTVNGKPYHLNALETLIQKLKTGSNSTKYSHYNDIVKKELGSKSQPSHWILMTKDVIPNSRSKTYDDQKQLMAIHAKKSGILYTFPTALEATTAILMYYVETRKYIYTDNKKWGQWTYTRCQEKVNKNQWPAAIGGFSSGGLSVSLAPLRPRLLHGVAGLRKF